MRPTREGRLLVILLGALILLAFLLPTLGWSLMGSPWMGPGVMQGYGPSGTGVATDQWRWGMAMGVGSLAMLAFWGALIVGALVGLRWLLGQGPGDSMESNVTLSSEDPRMILRRRYASGKIDQATYERMRREVEL